MPGLATPVRLRGVDRAAAAGPAARGRHRGGAARGRLLAGELAALRGAGLVGAADMASPPPNRLG